MPEGLKEQLYIQIFQSVMHKLASLIAIDIPKDVVAQGWARYKALQGYRDLTKFPPDQVYKLVLLLEQTIKSEHKPSVKPVVEVLGKKIEFEQFVFPIQLELKIKGGEVGIQAGKIINVSVAQCEAKGVLSISYANAATLRLAESREPIGLNKVFTLDEPVAIKSAEEIGRSLAFWRKKEEEAAAAPPAAEAPPQPGPT